LRQSRSDKRKRDISAIVISAVRAFEPVGCSLLRDWIEVSGPARNCAPCADIAIVHFAAVLGAKLIDRGCFYAFWPEYYALTGYASTGGWRGQQNLPEGCRRALEGGDGEGGVIHPFKAAAAPTPGKVPASHLYFSSR
jgi:hypothetical protein